jgi:conjugal transfer pilin signal peptidase TrbI
MVPADTSAYAVLGFGRVVNAWFARRAADQRALWTHFRRCWYVYLPLALAWIVAQHYLLFNWTRSLPYSVVWLDSARNFTRGDLIVYRFDGEELMYLKKGQRFFKRIGGMPGDRVSVENRRVLINGADVGIAKQYTLEGHRLEPLEPGVIPAGYYYVQGTHEMSFDSRYRASGLVNVSQIIGKVHVIF